MWLLIHSVKILSNVTFNLASCFMGHVHEVPLPVSTLDALTTMILDCQRPKQEFLLHKSLVLPFQYKFCYASVWQ